MKRMLLICALALACVMNVSAQALNNENVLRYIDRYRSLAMSEQQRTGIPAAIKLAQGIHETGAGSSKLAVEANNHFGLKCKAGWQGEKYAYTDDAPNECFRKYKLDFESYQDQSNYLKSNPRYASLFTLSVTDYAGWAIGLRKAGYATNPKYSLLLIKIIEDYRLQEYTYAAMGLGSGGEAENIASAAPADNYTAPVQNQNPRYVPQTNNTVPEPVAAAAPADNYTAPIQNQNPRYVPQTDNATNTAPQPVVEAAPMVNAPAIATVPVANVEVINTTPPARESKYIDTRPRDRKTVERTNESGVEVEQPVDDNYNVSKVNNLKAVYGKKGDMPLQYAVRNNIRYEKFLEMNDLKEEPLEADMPLYLERKHFWGIRPMHLVKPGETMLVIAQKEGIQLKYLRDLNYIEEGEEPMPGVTLELQAQAGTKPAVQKNGAIVAGNETTQSGSNATPRGTFRENPAPPHEEEKPLWIKMKEARQARKEARDAATQAKPEPADTQNSQSSVSPYPNVQTHSQNKQAAAIQTPPAQSYSGKNESSYIATKHARPAAVQNNAPAQISRPQPVQQQQQQVAQQPVQSYSSSQYSYRTTGNVKPETTIEEEEEEISKREARRNKKKEEEKTEVVNTTPEPVQNEKSELDALKKQFDNVIYAQKDAPAPRQQQAVQQQPVLAQQTLPTAAAQTQQPAAAQPKTDAAKMYTVKRGDTAYTIAKKHGITIRQLMDWNGLDFDTIREGQSLRVKQ